MVMVNLHNYRRKEHRAPYHVAGDIIEVRASEHLPEVGADLLLEGANVLVEQGAWGLGASHHQVIHHVPLVEHGLVTG